MDEDSFQRWAGDPDLAAAAQRDRDARRAEASDWEREGARHLLRERLLADVAVELLHRGDVVAVTAGGRRFTGTVVHAAGDVVCLATAAGDVDLNLRVPLLVRVVDRVPAGGRSRSRVGDSFKARLFLHEASGARVEVGTIADSEPVSGAVAAVARDHVVVEDRDVTAYVPLSAIAYVRPEPALPGDLAPPLA